MRIAQRPDIPPLAEASAIAARMASGLRPPRRRSVAECAEAHRVLDNPGGGYSGPWDFSRAPWTREPCESLSSGRYSIVVIMGAAQSAKSEVGLNWLLWTIIDSPANMILLHPSKDMMRDFVVTRISQMIRLTPEVRARQLSAPSSDNIFSKRFRGMTLWCAWPVSEQLRARPAPRWWQDDADDIPEDIDGQGSADVLLAARQTTFEGREVGLKTSSPARGPGRGIEADFEQSTAKRYYWRCPSCGEWWTPRWEDLVYKAGASPAEAELSAHLVCPRNGCVIEPRSKRAMVAGGRWVARGQTIEGDGRIVGAPPETRIDGYHFHGLIGFSSWGRLARMHREAELAFETRFDEEPLRAFYNTQVGVNYVSRVAGARPIQPSELAERVAESDYALGEVPEAVVCLTAAVDVQGDRFEVGVWGWGEGLESWLVDRFAILEAADGRTRIDPARYPEHWGALLARVLWRRYETAAGATLPILTTAIDTGGAPGVSDNAAKFWHTARRAGVASPAITLVKGSGNVNAQLLSRTYIERDARGRPKSRGAILWVLNANRWKDTLDARLRRARPGPGYVHLPRDLPEAYLEELTAEERQGRVWVKVRPRNETLDLMVYAAAGLARHAGERSDMGWVPAACRPKRAKADDDARAGAGEVEKPAPVTVVPRRKPARPRAPRGFVGGWR